MISLGSVPAKIWSVENSTAQGLVGSQIIKQWLGWGWLEKDGWTSQRLTRRMSVWDNQSSQRVWPLGLVLSELPSGRQCQHGAGPRARLAPPYCHGGLPGSPLWECVVWSPNTNALKWPKGNVISLYWRITYNNFHLVFVCMTRNKPRLWCPNTKLFPACSCSVKQILYNKNSAATLSGVIYIFPLVINLRWLDWSSLLHIHSTLYKYKYNCLFNIRFWQSLN